MALPVPNLDDRSWKQIVDEATRLIPRYCPEWTNHNASDPGITLLELYAWMTEMVIYRLNKVPEKNFLTFLDLIGVRLKAPEPAKVVLEFTPSEGVEGELVVKKGTKVATLQAGPAASPGGMVMTLSDLQAAGYEKHGIVADPQFSTAFKSISSDPTGFKPKASSPAKDAGKMLMYSADFVGTVIPQGAGPDIGAFEQ